MGDRPFLSSFLFLVLFFFSILRTFRIRNYFSNCLFKSIYLILIPLVLKYRKEAETGAAEEHPVRNISGYLSIY
jgi:hypothetical protein